MTEGIEASLINSNLDASLTDFIELTEIEDVVSYIARYIKEHRSSSEKGVIKMIQTSPVYKKVIGGTLGDLIRIIQGFRNTEACGLAHEQGKRINDVLLTPENCKRRDTYSGCGHVIENGLVFSLFLGKRLLSKADPDSSQKVMTGADPFLKSLRLDDLAASRYGQHIESGTTQRIIHLIPQFKELQNVNGSLIQDECQRLADALERLYN